MAIPKILSKKLYIAEQKIRGRGLVFDYLDEINTSQFYSTEKLERIQWDKLSKLLIHAYDTCPYYNRVCKNKGIDIRKIDSYEKLLKFPILDKDIIRKNIKYMVSNQYEEKDLILNYSSGSTGRPLGLYQTKEFKLLASAHQLRNYGWCGGEMGDKFALLWGSELYFKMQNFVDKFENLLRNRIELNTFRLEEKTMKDYAIRLSHFSPKLISTYPSSIILISHVIKKYNLPPIDIGAIQTTSETLTDSHGKYIEDFFRTKVFDKYGSRETNVISHECPKHQGMHINIENTFVEFLKDGKPVRPGETGEIVVTNLNNYGMPLIRYRMEDLGIPLAGKCNCGINLPRMSKVKGRKSDMIVTTDGNFVDSYLFSYILMKFTEIDIFQVIQEETNKIEIIIKLNKSLNSGFEDKVTKLIHKLADPNFKIKFSYVSDIPISASGKHRVTISKINHQW